jgi:hypothetical protein
LKGRTKSAGHVSQREDQQGRNIRLSSSDLEGRFWVDETASEEGHSEDEEDVGQDRANH